MADTPATRGGAGKGRSPESVDRLMVGGCAAIWLVLLVVSVTATVSLVDLGRGHRGVPESSSGLLYTIIGVSAVTIVAAVVLLLRARRDAGQHDDREHTEPAAADRPKVAEPRTPVEAPTEKMRVFGTVVDPSAAPLPVAAPPTSALDGTLGRAWLRGTASIAAAAGAALIGVAAAAQQLAEDNATAAVVALGVGGLITAAMPLVLIVANRWVRDATVETAGR